MVWCCFVSIWLNPQYHSINLNLSYCYAPVSIVQVRPVKKLSVMCTAHVPIHSVMENLYRGVLIIFFKSNTMVKILSLLTVEQHDWLIFHYRLDWFLRLVNSNRKIYYFSNQFIDMVFNNIIFVISIDK